MNTAMVIKGVPDAKQLKLAADIIKKGGIAILPTDTVYGFFCLADNKKAVKKIYCLKGRDFSKPLQVFVASLKEIKKIAVIGTGHKAFLEEKLPGPYTLIFKAKPAGVEKMKFINKTVGVRVVDSAVINGIIACLKAPLAATSANFSGAATPVKFKD
ncbi:MAG TPA: L-threonylcarbamoyladenylate synthase, partial [Candidatus Goldiibacteriota bacterium]|nr:L-threonylcarbamoyladenylate synthase [Candidatus Goldiibacteriota bacterium]